VKPASGKEQMEKIRAKLKCWWSGHDPDLSRCYKAVIPYREQDLGFTLIKFMGRNLYFGTTYCKRCGAKQVMNG
jgi:hypothetical protein